MSNPLDWWVKNLLTSQGNQSAWIPIILFWFQNFPAFMNSFPMESTASHPKEMNYVWKEEKLHCFTISGFRKWFIKCKFCAGSSQIEFLQGVLSDAISFPCHASMNPNCLIAHGNEKLLFATLWKLFLFSWLLVRFYWVCISTIHWIFRRQILKPS